jgi:hypothetical protein
MPNAQPKYVCSAHCGAARPLELTSIIDTTTELTWLPLLAAADQPKREGKLDDTGIWPQSQGITWRA